MNDFSIEPHLNDREILRQTLDQILKDFEMSGINIQFPVASENLFQELIKCIEPHVAKQMDKNYSAFLNLLYRIDINESYLKKEIENKKDRAVENLIAEIILKRELQKVVIRNYYKNNG